MTEALLKSPPLEPRRRQRLLNRIHRRFQTVTEDIGVGAMSIRFTRAADPNQVLDDIVAEEDRREKITGVRLDDPQHLPYWAELWDSARGVAAALAKMDWSATTRVLDLGCGMGLCGATAAALAPGCCWPTWNRQRCCSPGSIACPLAAGSGHANSIGKSTAWRSDSI